MSYSNAVALQMPSSYVPMTSEEMTYLEGGNTVISTKIIDTAYIDAGTCASIAAHIGGGGFLTARALSKLTGLVGWVIDGLLAVATVRFGVAAGRDGLRIDYYKQKVYSNRDGCTFDRTYYKNSICY